jgi:hypothetical protein
MMATPFTRHGQEETCLKLDFLNGWLMGVDARRVKETVRDALIAYQRECHRVLFEHFFRKTGGYRQPRQRLSPEAEAARWERNMALRERETALREGVAALGMQQQALYERQQAIRELHEIRLSGAPRAEAAKAASEIFRRLGIDLDATLAQGEFPFKPAGGVH